MANFIREGEAEESTHNGSGREKMSINSVVARNEFITSASRNEKKMIFMQIIVLNRGQ